ncbi:MAG: IMP cyclohydrolase [Deltaproteobacteria bacterium]|nr:MAG: IMP cyclohydrolase [Deltaproteobacteria bacterium]
MEGNKSLKQMYRRIIGDHFPDEIEIRFGDQALLYRKKRWKIMDPATGELTERGLRYGENPDQEAALYELVEGELVLGDTRFVGPGMGLVSSVTEMDMIQAGKHPGKINLTDIDSALNIIRYLTRRPAAVIIKHNNPCGVAYGKDLADAYYKANMADRIAAFGGCAVFNRPMDKDVAEMVSQNYLEVVVAPEFEEGAVDILTRKKDLRIIKIKGISRIGEYADKRFVDFKSLMDGGIILQQSFLNRIKRAEDLKPASAVYKGEEYRIEREPTDKECEDMLFGWADEQGITSNSVIYVKDGVTVGIGTGEQDRVGCAEIAIFKAYIKYTDAICFKEHGIPYNELKLMVKKGEKDKGLLDEIEQKAQEDKGGLRGACMVSDGFFPFRDSVDVAAEQGISAIIQPGGSVRDHEVIEACNEYNITMVFTGQRAFRH